MVKRINGLTLRQAQALVSIAHKKNNLGIAKLKDLITDMGVAFATLADHLHALQKRGYIETPDDNQKKTRNLAFNDKITITPEGERVALSFMKSINASYDEDASSSIFNKLKKSYAPKSYHPNLYGGKNLSFAKAFEELIKENQSEPVLASIAMYTDLDSQLSVMRIKNLDEYIKISRAKLNLEIRNGRLASIAIPTAIRRTTRLTLLNQILGSSWSWMGTVSTTSRRRYWQEAMSLGLLQVRGDWLTSMKPTTTTTIKWLAEKTAFTFINTIPVAPKSSLVLFRESFKFPSEEDLLNPKNADSELPWLNFIWDNIIYKKDYIDAIREGLSILKDSTNVLQECYGTIVPTITMRKINNDSDLKTNFKAILKKKDESTTAKVLMAISAKPAISIYELVSDLNKKAKRKKTIKEIEEAVDMLINNNLVHNTASSHSAMTGNRRLFSFNHLPFFDPKAIGNEDVNAVLRSLNPYLLQLIRELFTPEEMKTVYQIFVDLMHTKSIDLGDVEKQYNQLIMKKMLLLGDSLKPFLTMDKKELSTIYLNEKNVGISNVLIGTLLYSVLTQNEALDMYSQTISDLVEKDKPWAKEIEEESKWLVPNILQENMKTGFL